MVRNWENPRRAWLTLPLVLMIASSALADDGMKKPYLWKVELPGAAPAFVFGTMHVPEQKIVNQPRIVGEALERSDVFFAEIPMDMGSLMKAAETMIRTDGGSLEQDLPPKLYARVKKYVEHHNGSMATLDTMKPWAAMMQVMLADYQQQMMTGMPLDMKLYVDAMSAGKEVGGIETLDEQLSIFAGMSKKDLIHLFETTMHQLEEAQKEGKSYTRQLIEEYLKGDHEALRAIAFEDYDQKNEIEKKFIDKLLIKRDARITQRFLGKMRKSPEKRHFLAVGAAHLGGKDGVLAHLKKAGATLNRLGPDDMNKLPAERD